MKLNFGDWGRSANNITFQDFNWRLDVSLDHVVCAALAICPIKEDASCYNISVGGTNPSREPLEEKRKERSRQRSSFIRGSGVSVRGIGSAYPSQVIDVSSLHKQQLCRSRYS
jgi:hypothetical protein